MPQAASNGARRQVVLIAEDESSIRESLLELFVDHATVIGAANLAEALDALREHDIDLIISDLRLGAKTDGGFQIMAAAGLLAPNATVIALTAFPSDASREASARLGAIHFLVKPVDLEEIAAVALSAGVVNALASELHQPVTTRDSGARRMNDPLHARGDQGWSTRRFPPRGRG